MLWKFCYKFFCYSLTIYICRDSLACPFALIFLKVEFRRFCQPPTRLYSVCGRRPWCCSRVSNEARDRRTVLQRKRLDGEETREERRGTERGKNAGLDDKRRECVERWKRVTRKRSWEECRGRNGRDEGKCLWRQQQQPQHDSSLVERWQFIVQQHRKILLCSRKTRQR